MKYTELAKRRDTLLFCNGELTCKEFMGNNSSPYGVQLKRSWHVCWFSVCTSARNDWYKCEVCGTYDPERKPYNKL